VAGRRTKARYAFVFGDLRRVHRRRDRFACTAPRNAAPKMSNSQAHDLLHISMQFLADVVIRTTAYSGGSATRTDRLTLGPLHRI
jgi:hypothetical protein